MPSARPKIAFWFRYGPAEHTELWHALPLLIEALSKTADIHYFGLHSNRPTPALIEQYTKLHILPIKVDRTSNRDKVFKTLIWYLCLPWIAIRCRFMRIDLVYIDETLPLLSSIVHPILGHRLAMTIADFFVDVYFTEGRLSVAVREWIRRRDMKSWRHLRAILVKTGATRDFLSENGIDPRNVHVVPDPCDTDLYGPRDRETSRRVYGYEVSDIVLVHHGILHPNKGNDLIIKAIAGLRDELPGLRFLLIGSGPEEAALRSLCSELKVNDIVTFTGWLETPEDVCVGLNAGDIGLVMRKGHKSDDFHVTGTLVHNMACGLPILAAGLAGVREIVREGKEGFIFDPETMSGFADALIKMSRDADLRKDMSQASLRASRQFDMKTVVNATVMALLGHHASMSQTNDDAEHPSRS